MRHGACRVGGLVFFDDMGGNSYAFDAAKGAKLWATDLAIVGTGSVDSVDGAEFDHQQRKQ